MEYCNMCGRLVSYGLRSGDLIFCMDECAEQFGIDPSECFYGDVSDHAEPDYFDE